METEAQTTPGWRDEDHNPLVKLLLKIRGSFLLFTAAVGVFMILAALLIYGGTGVLSAMFTIWGVSAILYAAGGLLFLRVIGYR
jgi:hypothetical protein